MTPIIVRGCVWSSIITRIITYLLDLTNILTPDMETTDFGLAIDTLTESPDTKRVESPDVCAKDAG